MDRPSGDQLGWRSLAPSAVSWGQSPASPRSSGSCPAPASHRPRARTGIAALDWLAPVVHWGLYAAVIAMALSGMALSVTSGLGVAVWGEGAMPADFAGTPARAVHGILSTLVLALIGLHILGALFHGAVKGDGLMGRMWFGR